MPFLIIRNDITSMTVDAVVNPTDADYSGRGGVDHRIHRAAGRDLDAACAELPPLSPGEAVMTPGFGLGAACIIHTVGPVWRGGRANETQVLASCYRRSLELALGAGCETVAIPLIASGAFRFPKETALRVASDTVRDFLHTREGADGMTVFLVVWDRRSVALSEALTSRIAAFIDDHYVEEEEKRTPSRRLRGRKALDSKAISAPPAGEAQREDAAGTFREPAAAQKLILSSDRLPSPDECVEMMEEEPHALSPKAASASVPSTARPKENRITSVKAAGGARRLPSSLDEALRQLDKGFSTMLLEKIDEKGMTDAECYHRANIDRKLFSKIRSNPQYRPTKATVLAFAIALKLSLDETNDLLRSAGFAFSSASRFDVIIRYFIEQADYDIYHINEALFTYDQGSLGG